MTTEELKLADKILADASVENIDLENRDKLLIQYERLIRAARLREDAEQPTRKLGQRTLRLEGHGAAGSAFRSLSA